MTRSVCLPFKSTQRSQSVRSILDLSLTLDVAYHLFIEYLPRLGITLFEIVFSLTLGTEGKTPLTLSLTPIKSRTHTVAHTHNFP